MNVGGTGKLPMTTLVQMCETVGFEKVKTYIASGNVVFRSNRSEDQVRSALEDQLYAYAGKSVGVIVRTASEIGDVLARNPFADVPDNRVMVLFADEALPANPLDGVTGSRTRKFTWGSESCSFSTRMVWRIHAFASPATSTGRLAT